MSVGAVYWFVKPLHSCPFNTVKKWLPHASFWEVVASKTNCLWALNHNVFYQGQTTCDEPINEAPYFILHAPQRRCKRFWVINCITGNCATALSFILSKRKYITSFCELWFFALWNWTTVMNLTKFSSLTYATTIHSIHMNISAQVNKEKLNRGNAKSCSAVYSKQAHGKFHVWVFLRSFARCKVTNLVVTSNSVQVNFLYVCYSAYLKLSF